MNVLGFHPFRDRKAYTRHIGVVFGQRTQLWWDIAVQESFRLLASIYDVPRDDYRQRLDQLCDVLELRPLLGTPVRKLSLGQRLRCDLASSLLHGPKILFLDEPTIGLDAVAKDAMRRFLRIINRDLGVTIILTTHDLKEIEELCRRIIVIDKGSIIYDGGLGAIRRLPGLGKQVVIDFSGPAPLEQLSTLFLDSVRFTAESERKVTVQYDPSKVSTVDIVKSVFQNFDVADLQISEPDIEQVIMKIYREGVAHNGSGVSGAQ
ncbi:MAG: ATP-binding cassette domain-containing protein, partial [Bdellovibrionales bacterium]|nr:ATP-binding cassette domain-containing protein [Bdellovibrionales bacterium]